MATTHTARGRQSMPGDRYPLASRHGDTALYVPGAIMVLGAVVRAQSDALGVVLAVLGAAAILVGMLMPSLQGAATVAPSVPVPAPTVPPTTHPVLVGSTNGSGPARDVDPAGRRPSPLT